MSDLISRKKIRDYIKGEINHYGKPFEGTSYELGLKIMRYIDAMDSTYSVDNVVEELKMEMKDSSGYSAERVSAFSRAIEIVKHGGVSDDVCEWEDCAIGIFNIKTSCGNSIDVNYGYEFCPYCGKKIKVVE